MIICDDRAAIIGGMNLASECMGPQDAIGRWQDLSLLVEGPVTGHLIDIFRSDWKFASNAALSYNSTTRQALESDSNSVTQLVASGPHVRNDSLRNAILTAIFRANRRIWVVTPLRHIQKSVVALNNLTASQLAALQTGEAYVWANKATHADWTTKAIKVMTRPRVTLHGGSTQKAVN
jgi:phosphatidylserine/phosphatidylglycerophosphate/cardiolipin synthase-like enzyme